MCISRNSKLRGNSKLKSPMVIENGREIDMNTNLPNSNNSNVNRRSEEDVEGLEDIMEFFRELLGGFIDKIPGLEKLLNVMKNLATAWAVIVVAVFIAATVAWIISFKDILSIYSQVAGTIIAKQTTLGGVFISFILLALSTIIVLAIGVFTLTILLPLTIIVSIEIGERYIGKIIIEIGKRYIGKIIKEILKWLPLITQAQ